MKKCPYCGEEIQDDAQKCRYCGEWLKKQPSYFEKHQATIILSVVVSLAMLGVVLAVCMSISQQREAEETMRGLEGAMEQQRKENAKVNNSYYERVSDINNEENQQ